MNTTDSTIHYTAPYSQQSGICIYIYIYFYVLYFNYTALSSLKPTLPNSKSLRLLHAFFWLLLKRRMDNDESNPYTFDNDLNLDFAVCLETFPPQNGAYSTTAQTFLLHLAGDVTCPW